MEERCFSALRLLTDDSQLISDPFMRRAYELARLGAGLTSPNPMVGCVIVREGEIVGEGYHAGAGEPHAEAVALEQAGARAAGAIAYVTLEPCAHHGLTPPCTEALIAAGISTVVAGMKDPNPKARGGCKFLRANGVEVSFASDPFPYERLNEEWLHHLRTGLPFTRVKVALSLDGKITFAPGKRCFISGAGGAEITMTLRSRADAVLVGASTAATDNPALTVRDATGTLASRQPARAILCTRNLPKVDMLTAGAGKVLILVESCATVDEFPECATLVRYDTAGGMISALKALSELDVRSLLVEAGPRLFSALWQDGLIDELVVVHAGGVFGASAPSLYTGAGQVESNRLEARMRAVEAGIAGGDAVTVWRRAEDICEQ